MRNLYRIVATCLLIILTLCVTHAQEKKTPKELIAEGIKLHDEGKFGEAIMKYKEALQLDSNNIQAEYEMASSYYASGSNKEAKFLLEKIIATKAKHIGGVYDILGTIYDDEQQPEKAIETYKKGIEDSPDYYLLYFNAGITYYKLKNYPEAEKCAIAAIKIDNKHPGSQWLYAMVNSYKKNKLKTILGLSSFLMLEPTTVRAGRAYTLLEQTLNAGVAKKDEKNITVTISDDQLKSNGGSDMILSIAAANVIGKNLPPVEQLQELLKSAFEIAGESLVSADDGGFFKNMYADYFSKLELSSNMPAFSRYISLSAYKDDNLAWFKANEKQLQAFQTWVNNTQRNF